jgi:hypothetical protein
MDAIGRSRYADSLVLIVRNGAETGADRVAAAVITVDGRVLAGPSQLNQQVAEVRTSFPRAQSGDIGVEARGAPGSFLEIEVVGALRPGYARVSPLGATVASEGGKAELVVGPGLSAGVIISLTQVAATDAYRVTVLEEPAANVRPVLGNTLLASVSQTLSSSTLASSTLRIEGITAPAGAEGRMFLRITGVDTALPIATTSPEPGVYVGQLGVTAPSSIPLDVKIPLGTHRRRTVLRRLRTRRREFLIVQRSRAPDVM